jgi:hypothetical protein
MMVWIQMGWRSKKKKKKRGKEKRKERGEKVRGMERGERQVTWRAKV